MLTLVVFAPAMGLKSPSPFSMKAIALMQMSGLDYKIKAGDPRKSPKKKLPVLIDGNRQVPDSSHIQAYLENEKGIDFDGSINAEQKAVAQSFRCLCEDHLYWVGGYVRWVENADYAREEFFGSMPKLMKNFIFNMVQKQLKKSLYGQGIGRHTPEEIHAFGATDIAAIAAYLGDKDYFFGDKPTSIDAVIFSALINNIVPKVTYSPAGSAKTYPNLVAYCDRFIARFNIPQV